MNPADRARLTSQLREHVASVAADLRAKMRAPGDARERARKLHADEQVAEDFEVWTDLLSRRAAVLWVLKSVYVRVLEDRGLLRPGRLLDPEAQQLFEKLAPNLGETAFLRWVYRDLAKKNGGVPELFSPQPAEVASVSDDCSRALIRFWRHRDADTGASWSFREERFEGELMGDLYQELDPVVKDRFALCQTPDFVREFILDRTLTPAIEAFGADQVRLLDPACGSGHFLIDGLKRLVAATSAQHPDWPQQKVALHALERVVGIDLNDYACALARVRLVMTAAELAGVTTLAEAAQFHPHVYWADGLEQVEREESKPTLQYSLFEQVEEKPRATLTRSDVRAALKEVLAAKFHAVVANPPYIVESDDARKAYHREKIGKKQRYVSAYRQYSLASPFTERCFQLAVKDGFVGLITSNNFMKREFGKPLIETVLAGLDLTLVVDTSHASIPFHATPTVLLFGRNRRPSSETVRAVMGKRGESGMPDEPARGRVWSSIAEGWASLGFENEYVSVAVVPRETLGKHPWSLGGGGAAELKVAIERRGTASLGTVADIGVVCMTRADDIYVGDARVFTRLGVPQQHLRAFPLGNSVRDWSILQPEAAVFPYDEQLVPLREPTAPLLIRFLWRYRAQLWERREPNGNHREIGLTWHEWSRLIRRRLGTALTIAFAKIATHNHFVLDRGACLFSDGTPVIKLPAGATEDDHLALLGLLNSSVACFWMKQVFHPKGSATHDVDKAGTLPENNRYEFAATGMERVPLPAGYRESLVVDYARRIDTLAAERARSLPPAVISTADWNTTAELKAALERAREVESACFLRMVFWQEELDWESYRLFGLVPWKATAQLPETPISPEMRPFEWSDESAANSLTCPQVVADEYRRRFLQLRADPVLQLLENSVQKRLWRGTQGVFGRYDRTYEEKARTAMREWLADRVEAAAKERGRTFTLEQMVASLQDDARVLAVCEVLTGKKDFSLAQLVADALQKDTVPNHPFHVYKPAGLVKRAAWERTWEDQRREDAGEKVTPEVPPSYGSGDFVKTEYWQLRGKLDVPKERFVAFTEVPGRAGAETLYGWAGWTPRERVKAILALDEELEDAGVSLADRVALLDSAWRLLPDVAREDAAAAARLKAELSALVGATGPSKELLEEWRERFPPPSTRAPKKPKAAKAAPKKKPRNAPAEPEAGDPS